MPVPEVLAYDFSKKHISSNYFFMTELTGVTFSSDDLFSGRGKEDTGIDPGPMRTADLFYPLRSDHEQAVRTGRSMVGLSGSSSVISGNF